MSSKTAVDDLAAFIQQTQADWANDPDNPTYRGSDWWQLSEEEEQVFSLSLDDMPELVGTWGAYQLVLENWHEEPFITARSELPWLAKCEDNQHDWQRFATLFSVPEKNAAAFYWKDHFWTERSPLDRKHDNQDITKDKPQQLHRPTSENKPDATRTQQDYER